MLLLLLVLLLLLLRSILPSVQRPQWPFLTTYLLSLSGAKYQVGARAALVVCTCLGSGSLALPVCSTPPDSGVQSSICTGRLVTTV
jgi:hypothetical protein